MEISYEKNHELRKLLDSFYSNKKININNGKDCISYYNCSKSCKWENKTITPPTGAYIGDDYEKYRILFIGINTNYGSVDSKHFYNSYRWISNEISDRSTYIDGAIHRIIQKIFKREMKPSESKKYFAFSNAIKCSVNKRAGKPTNCMYENCCVQQGYIFEEISILKPSIIITLGNLPFDSIRNHYFDTITHINEEFKDWMFSLCLLEQKISVIRFYNPVQGYRYIRKTWKQICDKSLNLVKWEQFLPADIQNNNLKNYLCKKYNREELRVDLENPFYDLVIDKLFNIAIFYSNLTKELGH